MSASPPESPNIGEMTVDLPRKARRRNVLVVVVVREAVTIDVRQPARIPEDRRNDG